MVTVSVDGTSVQRLKNTILWSEKSWPCVGWVMSWLHHCCIVRFNVFPSLCDEKLILFSRLKLSTKSIKVMVSLSSSSLNLLLKSLDIFSSGQSVRSLQNWRTLLSGDCRLVQDVVHHYICWCWSWHLCIPWMSIYMSCVALPWYPFCVVKQCLHPSYYLLDRMWC